MNSYVHFHCGAHQLLLDAANVMAIEDRPGDAHRTETLRLWRGRQLPVIDLPSLLKSDGAEERQQIVIGISEQDPDACILDIDLVTALVELDSADFHALTPINTRLENLIDAVHVPSAGISRKQWLRLRTPVIPGQLQHPHDEEPS